MTRQEKQKELRREKRNCAQSVFGAFCEDYGLSRDIALKLASGFGGGAKCGELCGAVSGAIMAIGLKCGEDTAVCGEDTTEFINRFKSEFGNVNCADLLGTRNKSPEEAAEIKSAVGPALCPKLIEHAVAVLENMGL